MQKQYLTNEITQILDSLRVKVCLGCEITPEQFFSKKRGKVEVRSRRIFARLAKDYVSVTTEDPSGRKRTSPISLKCIAAYLNKKDHTTILNLCGKQKKEGDKVRDFDYWLRTDPELNYYYSACMESMSSGLLAGQMR